MEEATTTTVTTKRTFPPSTISLGSCICGVPIKLHLSFFILLLIEFITSFRYVNQFPIYMLFVVVMYGPVLLLTVLVHEFGHVWMNKRQGGEVGGIVLWVSSYRLGCFCESFEFKCH